MQLFLADTFNDSLAKLANDEQKQTKLTVFDLQQNPKHPGLRWHKLKKMLDPRFASVSVNMDLRLIVHRAGDSLLVCYVGHHDPAYRWASRRRLEVHPKTGAAQLVEVRERVEEIVVPRQDGPSGSENEADPPDPGHQRSARPLLAGIDRDALLGYGVPEDWVTDVQSANEDALLDIAERLPAEAAEAVLTLATGKTPEPSAVAPPDADPLVHPDAQRRFRLVADGDELQRALDYPWERWAVFLHPSQRAAVEKDYPGPARTSGSAGTGKTVVALHRAAALARRDDANVLLTSFSRPLVRLLRVKSERLVSPGSAAAERLRVRLLDDVVEERHEQLFGQVRRATDAMARQLVEAAVADVPDHRFRPETVWAEWREVVDTWQLDTWEAYRDVRRLGRKTRLGAKQREKLWEMFRRVQERLSESGLITLNGMYAAVAAADRPLGDVTHVVVDEAQDVSVAQLRLLAAAAGDRPDGLFFAGDLGQRIFEAPFSWRELGVDVRGRSTTLRINYRTSEQIRRTADRLLGPTVTDVDGLSDGRGATVSVLQGPEPELRLVDDEEAEIEAVAAWLTARREAGAVPAEMAVFVRGSKQMGRAGRAVAAAGLPAEALERGAARLPEASVVVGEMHTAKGLEFRAVAVMACDEGVLPSEERLDALDDAPAIEEANEKERQLFYVACTRARDSLLVSGISPGSEFLEELRE